MKLTIYTDGGCRNGNGVKHNAYYSFQVMWRDQKRYRQHEKLPDVTTSMIAEWVAMLETLKYIREFELRNPGVYPQWTICQDSQVVVFQMTGRYAINAPHLFPYWMDAMKIYGSRQFRDRINIQWVPRTIIEPILGH